MIRTATAVTVALLPVLLLAAPAGAAEAPTISIALTDSVESARAGDTLQYVATVRNEGGAPAAVTVTLTPPPYVTLSGESSWQVELAGGESRELAVAGTVGEPAEGDYQVVTLASVASTDAPDTVLVRAIDADTIPGVEAPEPVAGLDGVSDARDEVDPTPWIVGGIGALLAAGAAVAWIARRRGSSAA